MPGDRPIVDLIALALAAIAPSSPTVLVPEDVFAQACFGGSVVLPKRGVTRTAFGDVPKLVQSHLRHVENIETYRLAGRSDFFLIVGTYAKHPKARACAVAAQNLSPITIRSTLLHRGVTQAAIVFPARKVDPIYSSFSNRVSHDRWMRVAITYVGGLNGWKFAETITWESGTPE